MGHLRFSNVLRAEMTSKLASFEPRRLPRQENRLAAVAIAIVPNREGQAAVILTRRAKNLRRHGGQFALPGGRVDPGETLVAACLRELGEEVGLAVSPSRVLGRLDDYATRSGFLITPMVVWGNASVLQPDPGEVAKVYRVPFADLGRPKALVETRLLPLQGPLPALSLKSVGTYVFCPTAAILHQFAELAVHGRHTPVALFPQPEFAWR